MNIFLAVLIHPFLPFPLFLPAFGQSSLPPSYLCTQSQVLSLIANLPLDSASGPDFISTHKLKHTARSIISPLIMEFFATPC